MSERARVCAWLAAPLDDEVARFVERVAHLPDAAAVAVMPDVHLAPPACVGTVVATRTWLYPELLGSDLGCGVAALPLGAHVETLVRPETRVRLLEALAAAVPVLRRRDARDEAPPPTTSAWIARIAEREGRAELGTIGRGNHFLEIHEATDGALWLVVHTGSRSTGPAIQAVYRERATARHRGFAALPADDDVGRDYLRDVAWAIDFAALNRACVIASSLIAIGDVIAIAPGARVDCQHDSVRVETHDVGEVFVHRKGAMAITPGARGVLPGSMGAPTYLVVGRDEPTALASCAHGAGRAVPRGEARRRFDRAHLAEAMRGVCFDARRADALRDEAPAAYKDVRAVMRAQRALVRAEVELAPRIVHKGA